MSTPDPAEAAKRQPVARTAAQGGAAAAVIVVLAWLAALARLDLAPGPATDLPLEVAGALQFLLTWAAAALMNRPKDRPASGPTGLPRARPGAGGVTEVERASQPR